MKGKDSPTKLLDKTIWDPRPVIGLASLAVSGSVDYYLLFLGHRKQKYWPTQIPRSPAGVRS